MNADSALQLLVEGNGRYVADKESIDTSASVRSSLVSGQSPYAIILSCADSRVIPESIFDAMQDKYLFAALQETLPTHQPLPVLNTQ